jgi:hypothetical protein
MNLVSSDFNFFIEHDSNPFIIFDSSGHIKYLNQSAETLPLNPSTTQKLYDIALLYAPKTYGVKKTILELSVSTYEFYGVNVLYQNDDEIALHLYNKPITNIKNHIRLSRYSITDINILLQANIELFKIEYQGDLKLFTDYDIPKFQLNQNDISILLRKTLLQFNISNKIYIELRLKIGEIIVVDSKRCSIVLLNIKGDTRDKKGDKEIEDIAKSNYINIYFQTNTISLELPLLKS